MLDRLVSQSTKLKVYFTLNFIAAIIAWFISWRALLFFSVYIFLIWYYSHKIKRYPLIGNLMASLMAVLPFFAILLYYYTKLPLYEIESYKSQFMVIFAHATFLFLLLLIREMIKDLENIKGDIADNYQTIPVLYGEKTSKKIISILTCLTLFPIYILIEIYDVGYMDIYFYSSLIILIFCMMYLWKSNTKTQFLLLHNVLKFLIVSGVFCIILIDPSVLWHGKKLLFTF
jgi:4-hydroxybenzoate polyprenyltransferase